MQSNDYVSSTDPANFISRLHIIEKLSFDVYKETCIITFNASLFIIIKDSLLSIKVTLIKSK